MFYAEAYLELSRTCFFFLFLVMLSSFFIIPMVKEKIKVKPAPAIPTVQLVL